MDEILNLCVFALGSKDAFHWKIVWTTVMLRAMGPSFFIKALV